MMSFAIGMACGHKDCVYAVMSIDDDHEGIEELMYLHYLNSHPDTSWKRKTEEWP